MLDQSIKEQLKEGFDKLTDTVILQVSRSSHADQSDLISMVNDLASTSERIQVTRSETQTDAPLLNIL